MVTRDPSGMHLSQAKYAAEILDKAGYTGCTPATTPVDTSPKLASTAGAPVEIGRASCRERVCQYV